MRVACWISKVTRACAHACARATIPIHTHPHACTDPRARAHTRTEICNILVFPRQQWFGERASKLRYTYIACVVNLLAVSLRATALSLKPCVPTCTTSISLQATGYSPRKMDGSVVKCLSLLRCLLATTK